MNVATPFELVVEVPTLTTWLLGVVMVVVTLAPLKGV